MAKNTPIRLVALDEEPPDDDPTEIQEILPEDTAPTPAEGADPEQEAAPVRSTPEHEAITRRVPAIAAEAAQAPEWPKPTRTWRRYIPLIVALVPVGALSTAWFLSRPARTPEAAVAPAPHGDQLASPSAPLPSASPASPNTPMPTPGATNAPDVIRLQITAEPVQAELSLDGNVLAGHQLNLEVPKDRGIHVVSATAPGYFPFNQQVSFSNDIVLRINLRRAHGSVARPISRHPSAESKTPMLNKANPPAPQVEAKAQSPGKRSSAPRFEPGMDLDAPTPRHGAKSIDERNPYRP